MCQCVNHRTGKDNKSYSTHSKRRLGKASYWIRCFVLVNHEQLVLFESQLLNLEGCGKNLNMFPPGKKLAVCVLDHHVLVEAAVLGQARLRLHSRRLMYNNLRHANGDLEF